MRSRSGQVSVEHMVTIAIAIFILIPGTALFYSYAKASNEEVAQKQISRIGNELMKNVELVNALGNHSRIVLQVNMPNSVEALTIYQDHGTELVFSYTTFSGNNEMMFYTPINMSSAFEPNITENFHSGMIKLSLTNAGHEIIIAEQT